MDILHFFGSTSFQHHLTAMTSPKAPSLPPVPYLSSTLKSWQWIGKNKLKLAAASMFGGALLCDQVGLGKSLTSLLAALEIRSEMATNDPYHGPVLVICRPSCLLQWAGELQRHWQPSNVPSYIILDRKEVQWSILREYQVIICSHHFARSLYQHEENDERYNMVARFDPDMATKHVGAYTKKTSNPLNSASMQRRNEGFSVLILDESQDAKSQQSLLNRAVRHLRYKHAFLLTGTPFYNTWQDLAGQLRLLPQGGPFHDLSHFLEVFATKPSMIEDPEGLSRSMLPPQRGRKVLFELLTAALIVGRPKECLQLPEIRRYDEEVTLRWSTVLKIAHYFARGRSLLAQTGEAQSPAAGFAMFDVARMLGGNQKLVKPTPTLDNHIQSAFTQFAQQRSIPSGSDVDTLSDAQFALFETHWKAYCKSNKILSGRIPGPLAVPIVEIELPPSQFSFFERGHILEEELPNETSSYPLPHPTAARQKNAGVDTRLAMPEPRNAKDANECAHRIRNFTDEELYSPRIRKIMQCVGRILNRFSDDKLIVASTSLTFLSVVKEALRRQKDREGQMIFDVGILEYNGTITNQDSRADVIQRFNVPGTSNRILLLSAQAGGTGLNISGANHLILSELYWSPGFTDQLIGRVHRMPQTKIVYVYQVVAPRSAFDIFQFHTLETKTTDNADLSKAILRRDDAHYTILPLPAEHEL